MRVVLLGAVALGLVGCTQAPEPSAVVSVVPSAIVPKPLLSDAEDAILETLEYDRTALAARSCGAKRSGWVERAREIIGETMARQVRASQASLRLTRRQTEDLVVFATAARNAGIRMTNRETQRYGSETCLLLSTRYELDRLYGFLVASDRGFPSD